MNSTLFRRMPSPVLAGAALLAGFATAARAQDTPTLALESYLTPPAEIRDAVLAPWHRNRSLENLDPAERFFVVEESDRRLPPLAAFAKKHYRLGGLEVDVAANRNRSLTIGATAGLRLVSWRDGREVEVRAPNGAMVSDASWSPDGRTLAFLAHFDDATHIYTADPRNGETRRLTETPLLATLVTDFEWSGDGRYIFAVLIPEDRGPEPPAPEVATTPRIQLTLPEKNVLRTYPSLLQMPHEFALLEHYAIGQLARIEVDGGDVHTIGRPAMIDWIDPAPDGEYVRVRTIRKPYSDIVPVRQFATVEEIWDMDGDVVVELASRPVRDGGDDDDDDGGAGDKRSLAWRPDGQGLSFLQLEPRPARSDTAAGDAPSDEEEAGGDEGGRDRKDRVMQWLPPFDSASLRVVYESDERMQSVAYTDDAGRLFVTERSGGREVLYAVSPSAPESRDTIYNWRTEDFYDSPGNLMMTDGRLGLPVVRVSSDGGSVFLQGTQYHENPLEDAPQPFIDRVEIATGETSRIFESSPDRYETVEAVLDADVRNIVISRESSTEVANFFHVDLASGAERRLTDNRDYTPDITRARREVIEVERPDGVVIQATVTVPENFTPSDGLPAMFWFYPSEYASEEAYQESHRRYNKNRFPSTSPRSMEILVRRGWAVVEPDVPIIGPRDSWNDLYVLHLRNSLAAIIDELDSRGYIDRQRLAIGGHSYGGFGTLNAMIHTPFFKAGIAGAANSNRTLTPTSFQRESRTLWESRDSYIRMSPMFYMNELTGAVLMYHGMEDQNVGTFPINTERAFHALNALGKTAALYMYPYEAHGQRAEETLLDMWSRWIAWLDQHVLGTPAPAADAVAEDVTASDGR